MSDRSPGLLHPEAIEQFRAIAAVPRVDDRIVAGLRRADEKAELEPALMSIVGDVDETPHGPTEIADIIPIHLRVLGEPALGAVVIKGRALGSVTAKAIDHQLVRAAKVTGVRLLVLAAVGDIQDDAKDHLSWLANSISADWLILDRSALARLFVAYGELCPRDGSWLRGEACACGYVRRPGRRVVRPPVSILTLEDVSTAAAKRYGAHILVSQGLSDDEVEERIRAAIPRLRAERYSRDERVAERHAGRLADVVFVYVYEDATDRPFANWICRALWVSPEYTGPHPAGFGVPHALDPALRIDWNASYELMAELLVDRIDKGTYLEALDEFLRGIEPLVEKARSFLRKDLSSEAEVGLASLERVIDALPRPDPERAPPHELTDLDNILSAVLGDLMNLTLPFRARGHDTWPDPTTRQRLGRWALEAYDKDRLRLEYERSKVR